MLDQSKRVALITGGSSGIGYATAQAFARQGVKVVIASRGITRGEQAAHEICAAGGEALFLQTDVSQAEQVEALVTTVVKTFGRLDYACNNAGTGLFALTAEVSEEDFDYVIGVNLKGVWLCMKYELQHMLKQGEGAIVNISSINAFKSAAQASIYCASKSGVLGLTRAAAREYAQAGIRVNALCPGPVRTPMLETIFEDDSPEAEARYTDLVPMGRIGKPEEAAEVVLWLCSSAASYVTGHTMIMDGGLLC